MTPFEVREPPVRTPRSRAQGAGKPVWNRYHAKTPNACTDCEQVALETLPGPMPVIRRARFTRRQDGVTRWYCHAHARTQREVDDLD